MKHHRIRREDATPERIAGLVLCADVGGRKAGFAKGHILGDADAEALRFLEWDELHALEPDAGDVLEEDAGLRLATAAAGSGVTVGEADRGQFPLIAGGRGVLEIDVDSLDAANAIDGICVYTLLDGSVVDGGETVARARALPLVIEGERLTRAEAHLRSDGGIARIRAFRPMRVAAIVSETLGSEAVGAFRTALSGKLEWFGSVLMKPHLCANEAAAIADALRAAAADGAELVLFAGTRAMDPMDAAFSGLEQAGARMQRSGVPVHPGSFLWLARLDAIPVLGVPSCGLFSKTTSIDLLIARAHAGYPIDAAALARLGNGGLLGDATAYRLPSYGAARRGAPD